MVSFGFYANDFWVHACGGAIISDRIIITAAHCFRSIDESMKIQPYSTPEKYTLKIKSGDESLNIDETSDIHSNIHDIGTIKIHPKYNNSIHFDVALVSTNSTINFNDLTMPLCVPQENKPVKEHFQEIAVTITGTYC